MKTNSRYWVVFIASVVFVTAFSVSFAFGAGSRPEISAGERALAMMEVQNVFSKHAYYHQASKHCEEIADIWVAEDGPNAKTARWTLSGSTLLQGIDKVKDKYCTQHVEGQKETLATLSKKVPSVKNIPENIGAGGEYVMHTQETPVIEVAGDGKTAKGIWYSIGLAVRGQVDEDGNTSVGTGWMWEKYAVDFIKEDGEWKIWHLLNLMDQGPAESQGQDNTAQAPGGGQGGAPGGQGGAPPDMQGGAPPDMQGGGPPAGGGPGGDGGRQGGAPGGQGGEQASEYYHWSPTTAPVIEPPFPEPYYTFSETFEY